MVLRNGLVMDDAPSKVHKKVAIATSGVYQYHRTELPNLGLDSIPSEHDSRNIFNVYRPPQVLKDAVGLFVRLPVTREHPEEFVTPDNAKDADTDWIGWTGDSSDVSFLEEKNKFTINSTINLLDKEGIRAYDNGIREVSPGYSADFKWESGVDDSGTKYQIKMIKINEVNHLALVNQGRGGKDASILDHKGVPDMEEKNFLKQLFSAFKKQARVLDSIPKTGPVNDEQKEYLLKELARMLHHKTTHKTFDSFNPEGYSTSDDDGEESAMDDRMDKPDPSTNKIKGDEAEDSRLDKPDPSTNKIKGDEAKDSPENESEVEYEKKENRKDRIQEDSESDVPGKGGTERSLEKKETAKTKEEESVGPEDDEFNKEEGAEDAAASQASFPGQSIVEKAGEIKSSGPSPSTVNNLEPARQKDSIPINMVSGKVKDSSKSSPFDIMDNIRSGFKTKKEKN